MTDLIWLDWERDADGYTVEHFRPDEVDWNTLRPKVGAGDSVLRLLSFAPAQQFSDVVQPSGEFPRIWLAPIGKRVLRYQPLEECPALFREFADIEQTPEGAQGFANKYGLLGGGKTARVDWILGESRRMSEAVLKWEECMSEKNLDEAVEWINERYLAKSHRVEFSLHTDRISKERADIRINVPSLLSGLWIQFIKAVANGAQLRQCRACTTWFTYGTGTGRRRSAYYCSDNCRVIDHRRQRKGSKP